MSFAGRAIRLALNCKSLFDQALRHLKKIIHVYLKNDLLAVTQESIKHRVIISIGQLFQKQVSENANIAE